MNRSLRQLFIAVITLFAIIIASTLWWTVFDAGSLNKDPRNTRAFYHELSEPRGEILAANGTVLAESVKDNDTFKYQRKYSNGPLYAPITGFFSVATRANVGLEASENQLLSGNTDSQWLGRVQSLFTGQEDSGASVETSIQTALQQLGGKLLNGKTGAIVALDPHTGKILALVESPSYDPNLLATHDVTQANSAYQTLIDESPSPLVDKATKQRFAASSTFHLITAAAALSTGRYTDSTSIPATSTYTVPGTNNVITNDIYWSGYSTTSAMSLSNAFAYGSSTAFAQLGNALGYQTLADEAAKFGFGSTVTIDGTPSVGTPMTALPSTFTTDQSANSVALAAIGQSGVDVTPLEEAMMVSAVADQGTIMKPTLVNRIRSANLTLLSQTTPTVFAKPLTSAEATSLSSMMASLISTQAPNLELPNAKIAAVTGSSVNMSNTQNSNTWSVGFAPVNNPQIVVSVFLENTHGTAIETAAPIMQQMMGEALK